MRMSSTPPPEANGCTVGSSRQRALAEAEEAHDLVRELALRVDREVGLEQERSSTASASSAISRDERDELRLQLVEDRAHLGRRRPALVVVEQDVVRLVGGVEALDVAAASARRCARAPGGTSRSRRPRGARTQTWYPCAAARVSSARSSRGTRLAFSKSARVTRMRLASSDSGSSDSSYERSSSSSRPVSGATKQLVRHRPSVASCSARPSAAAGGIIVCWSQERSEPALRRSVISASRVLKRVRRSGSCRLA